MRTSLIAALVSVAGAGVAAQSAAADPYYLCWSDGQNLACAGAGPAGPPISRVTDTDVLGIPSTVADAVR